MHALGTAHGTLMLRKVLAFALHEDDPSATIVKISGFGMGAPLSVRHASPESMRADPHASPQDLEKSDVCVLLVCVTPATQSATLSNAL